MGHTYPTGGVMDKGWRHVSIPADLYQQIEDIVNHERLWLSIADFVRDAVRRRLEELGYVPVRAASGPGRPEGAGPASQPGRAQVGSAGRGPAGEGDDGE